MTMAVYVLSSAARLDLIELHDYIAKDKPVAAGRFIDRLKRTCQWLAENPNAGELQEYLAPGLRRFSFARYVIFLHPPLPASTWCAIVSGYRNVESLF